MAQKNLDSHPCSILQSRFLIMLRGSPRRNWINSTINFYLRCQCYLLYQSLYSNLSLLERNQPIVRNHNGRLNDPIDPKKEWWSNLTHRRANETTQWAFFSAIEQFSVYSETFSESFKHCGNNRLWQHWFGCHSLFAFPFKTFLGGLGAGYFLLFTSSHDESINLGPSPSLF